MDYQLTQTGAQVQEILDDAPITQQDLEAVEALLPEDVSTGNKLVDYNQMNTLLQAKQDKLTEQTTGTKVGDLSVKYGLNIGYGVTVGSDNQTKVSITPGSITKGQGTNIFDALATIETVIPSAASGQNKLTDKNYVDSAIATSSANFVGTFESLAELQAVQNPTNNDYGFVIEQDAQGNEYYDRYKFNGTQWLFEYKVESTPFTADQWAAIQSGITSALVTKLNALPTAQQINTALNGKQDTISDLASIRSGAAAGATAVQPVALQSGLATKQDTITDLAAIRSGAAAGATAAANTGDKAYDAATFSGLGRKNLPKNITTVGGTEKNVLTQAMVNTANTIYHIQYDYDLNGQTITLPAGCVLEFDGGSIKNGTLVGNLTEICAGYQRIFANVTPNGTWKNDYLFMEWLGYDHGSDGTSMLANAFEWGLPIKLLDAKYYFASLVVLPYGASMIGSGDETKVYTSGFGFEGLNTFSQMAVLPYSASVGCLFDIDSHYLRTSNNAKICINNVYAEADIQENYGDIIKLTTHSTNTISLGGFYNVIVQNVRSKGNFANGIHFYSEQESGQPAWITYCSFADCFFEKLKSLIKFECAAGANYNIPIFEGHKFLNITCQYYQNYTENVVVIEGVYKCLFDGVECVDRGTSIPMFSVANALSTFAVVNATTGDVLSSNYVVKTYSGETAAKDLFHQHVRLFSSLTDGLEYITPVKNGNLAHFIQKAPTYNGNIQFIEYGSTDSAKAFVGVLLTPSLTNTNKGSRGLVGINGLGQLVGRTIAVADDDDYSEIACERLVTFRTFPTIQGMTLLDAELKANGRMVCLTSSNLCMPMWYNLSTNRWNNALGVQVTNKITRSVGTSDQRTALGIGNATCVGFCYFDTTLGKPLWWNGTGWVDATGAPVANSLKVLAITQSAYDALTTKDANTLYVITQ